MNFFKIFGLSLACLPGDGNHYILVLQNLKALGESAVVLPDSAVPDNRKVQLLGHLTLQIYILVLGRHGSGSL